jgi:hypothetical protein
MYIPPTPFPTAAPTEDIVAVAKARLALEKKLLVEKARSCITDFYRRFFPTRLGAVAGVMQKYQGNERAILNKIQKAKGAQSITSCDPPTPAPTKQPTPIPTSTPTNPTARPTTLPTRKPSRLPTSEPTLKPTPMPASVPTLGPTVSPSPAGPVAVTVTPLTSIQKLEQLNAQLAKGTVVHVQSAVPTTNKTYNEADDDFAYFYSSKSRLTKNKEKESKRMKQTDKKMEHELKKFEKHHKAAVGKVMVDVSVSSQGL